MMLRTNLSTRPFYNERAVSWRWPSSRSLVLVVTVLNVTRLVALTRRQATRRRPRPTRRSASARDLRQKAAAARGAWIRRGSRRSPPRRTRPTR